MDTPDAVMDLAKRRGLLWPAYEAYGGLAGFYDYGPLGATMKKRLEDLWRHLFLNADLPMVEIACPRVTPHAVLKASGHVDEFSDLVVRCGNGHASRADHLVEAAGYEGTADALDAAAIDKEVQQRSPKCPTCGDGDWTAAEPLNLMNATTIGVDREGFLRPETAQGIFTDFPHLLRYHRGRLPFGVLQVGGANRNEISPRQGMVRLREFHMMECETFWADTDAPFPPFQAVKDRKAIFVPARTEAPQELAFGQAVADDVIKNEALAYFLALTQDFLLKAGMDPERLRFRQHLADEMAHYASDCWDAEAHSDRYGWVECVGIADRGCYDLSQHAEATGKASEFQVTLELDEPINIHASKLEPVMSVLGKLFKADAKRVAELMDAQFWDALPIDDSAIGPMPDAADLVLVPPKEVIPGEAEETLIDPKTDAAYTIPPDGYQKRRGEWRIIGRKIVPRVIEPSFGVDRILNALWEHAYDATEKNGEPYTLLRLSPHVAPVQVAVLPLTSALEEAAERIEQGLRKAAVLTTLDTSGSIGRRYARQDEIGTPICLTVDEQTTKDGTVTLRDRDTTEQARVQIVEIMGELARRFALD